MKKYIPISFASLFLLTVSYVFAGNTSLSTYFPPPSASYNTIKLATNYVAVSNTVAAYCTGAGSLNAIFLNSVTNTLYQCTATAGSANPYCASAAAGTVLADSTGTLHICVNGTDVIYPQQCHNVFCSYDSQFAASCAVACPTGFSQAPLDSLGSMSDKFQTTAHTWITSIVCCSNLCLTGAVNGTCSSWGACSSSTCGVVGSQSCISPVAPTCGGAAAPTTQACTGGTPVPGTCTAWGACDCNYIQTCTASSGQACGGASAVGTKQSCSPAAVCSGGQECNLSNDTCCTPTCPSGCAGVDSCGGTACYCDSNHVCSSGTCVLSSTVGVWSETIQCYCNNSGLCNGASRCSSTPTLYGSCPSVGNKCCTYGTGQTIIWTCVAAGSGGSPTGGPL